MGSWLGHAIPGAFFLLAAVWCTTTTMKEYYTKQEKYKNSTHRKCPCLSSLCQKINLQGIIMVMLAISGLGGEIITGKLCCDTIPMANTQHCAMYVAFALFAIIDIMSFHKLRFLPPGSEYLSLVLALIVELVLFAFHLHGRPPVDVHVHILLISVIALSVVSTTAEMAARTNITAVIARNFSIMLQGSWFIQMSFFLYPPWKDVNNSSTFYDLEDMENIMITTLIFSWHAIGCLMVTLILSGMVFWCCSPRSQGDYTQIRGSLNPSLGSKLPDHPDDESTLFINQLSISQPDEDEF